MKRQDLKLALEQDGHIVIEGPWRYWENQLQVLLEEGVYFTVADFGGGERPGTTIYPIEDFEWEDVKEALLTAKANMGTMFDMHDYRERQEFRKTIKRGGP